MTEGEFIAALRQLPLHAGARGLSDDVAVVEGLVVTTDTMVAGVHFLPNAEPGDVAWKLVATNLSDLAAKGALVEGVLLNYPLSDVAWDGAFLEGLREVLAAYDCPLIGGDTVTLPAGAPRVLTVTAVGRDAAAPPRFGARAGDGLWVVGAIGDAGAGLALLARGEDGPAALLKAHRRPRPLLSEGRALALLAHAMMDVSDGLLLDASRMAAASGLAVAIALDAVPVSDAALRVLGSRLAAATAGDDYALLCALPDGVDPQVPAIRIGAFAAGSGLTVTERGAPVALPNRLGWLHG